MLENAKWLSAGKIDGCPEFIGRFETAKKIRKATLEMSACGVYYAELNGKPVGDFVLAPGWTVYAKRIQVQSYDVTELMERTNTLTVEVASGWYCGHISRIPAEADHVLKLIALLTIEYEDGKTEIIPTDESWTVRESKTRFADIYDGEHYDADFEGDEKPVVIADFPHDRLVPQQGEKITYQEEIFPKRIITTPAGDKVLDFGQEFTGVIELHTTAPKGTRIRLTCAEMFDKDGNFYTENYRGAKSEMIYICGGNDETWRPKLTFYGLRYLRVEGVEASLDDFKGIVICSDIKRTGYLSCGDDKLNRLFENIIWGQKGNFLDVPTDCPQRDERLGWTGDAQVFVNTAAYQFDVKRFFTKWLSDMKLNQNKFGGIPCVIPAEWNGDYDFDGKSSTAWADAAVICPWHIYRHYGDKELLRSHFDMMKRWIGYMTSHTTVPDLWTGYCDGVNGHDHYGDWLGLDANEGSYVGATDRDLIASAYLYYSTSLVVLAGHELGEDVSEFEEQMKRTKAAFNRYFTDYPTQTSCVLALYFGLAEDRQALADKLAEMVRDNGNRLKTGFVGTPYLLYALSENGHIDAAYDLLCQNKFPSWLYAVEHGATTVWEHWDGLKEDGSFWSRDMNSFNHYAYGAVAGWVFETAAGITPLEPGFSKVRIAPEPDRRLGHLRAEYDTEHGKIVSAWAYDETADMFRYEITVPVEAEIVIDGKTYQVKKGTYLF